MSEAEQPPPGPQAQIEVVGGRIGPQVGEEIAAFWVERGAPDAAQARAFVPQVMCTLRDADGRLVGTSAVVASPLELVGNELFWIHQPIVAPGWDGAVPHLVLATFTALEGGFDPAGENPIGLAQLVPHPIERRRRREAEWSAPRAFYVGYLPGGIQVRVSYFAGAKVKAGLDG